jgi:hypothetical protein
LVSISVFSWRYEYSYSGWIFWLGCNSSLAEWESFVFVLLEEGKKLSFWRVVVIVQGINLTMNYIWKSKNYNCINFFKLFFLLCVWFTYVLYWSQFVRLFCSNNFGLSYAPCAFACNCYLINMIIVLHVSSFASSPF